MSIKMKQTMLAISVALGVALGQSGTFRAIDAPGAYNTFVWSMNKAGDIVGSYSTENAAPVGTTNYHAFKLSADRYTTADYPGAASTEAYGINNRGDIVGRYRKADGVFHGFTLIGDQFQTIDYPGASATVGWGIGPAGEVVGNYTLGGVFHGFKLSGTQYVTFDPPGSTLTFPMGINSQGEISGATTIGGISQAFILSDGEYTMISVPGSTFTNAVGNSSRGDVVGRYLVGGVSYGYALRQGIFTSIKIPGAAFVGAGAINERGDIVGRYYNADGFYHGFLLTGVLPECLSFAPRIALAQGSVAVTHSSTFRLVNSANPAAAGEILSLFASGLGPTRPSVAPDQPFPSSSISTVASELEVRVNGKPAEVLGAVGLPGTVGGYQVNFRVPADAPKGFLPLQLSVGMASDMAKFVVQ